MKVFYVNSHKNIKMKSILTPDGYYLKNKIDGGNVGGFKYLKKITMGKFGI